MTVMGRILGIDFGTRRIGAALSDPRRLIASPLEVYQPSSPARDALHYRRLVEEEGIDRIVVGLPLHNDGSEGISARNARKFGAFLADATGCEVVFHDERFSTTEAEHSLREIGLKSRDRQTRRDMLAARNILQAYLDAGCPTAEPRPAPLDDLSEVL